MLVAEVFGAGAYITRFSRHACQVYTTSKIMYIGSSLLVAYLLFLIKIQLLAQEKVWSVLWGTNCR